MHPTNRIVVLAAALSAMSCAAAEQAPHDMMAHGMGSPRLPGGCEAPAAENQGKMGCYLDQVVEISNLGPTAYYHIDEFADARAAERARTRQGVVVAAYGRTFLATVSKDGSWRPAGGTRVATIGPIPAPDSRRVTARFMQAMTRPGASTQPHSHDGPEAFHILSGAICMETPDGAETTAAGGNYWIGGGCAMQLSSVGAEIRRSLFVVIHPSDRPWMNVGIPWSPRGACGR